MITLTAVMGGVRKYKQTIPAEVRPLSLFVRKKVHHLQHRRQVLDILHLKGLGFL